VSSQPEGDALIEEHTFRQTSTITVLTIGHINF